MILIRAWLLHRIDDKNLRRSFCGVYSQSELILNGFKETIANPGYCSRSRLNSGRRLRDFQRGFYAEVEELIPETRLINHWVFHSQISLERIRERCHRHRMPFEGCKHMSSVQWFCSDVGPSAR